MKKILVLSFAIMLSVVASAQTKITEGVMTTEQTYSSENEQMQSQLDMMGEMIGTTYFKGTKSRAEISNPMSGDITVISDAKQKKTLTLMDNTMGKKYIEQSTEVSAETLKGITVVDGTETKTILGYNCKEKIVRLKTEGVDMTMKMFITDKITTVMSKELAMLDDKINGCPLYIEMSMNQQGMNMTITTEVIKLEKVAVPDAKFSMAIPEGYTKMEGM